MTMGEVAGQGWLQGLELALAFLLSAMIGCEREIRHKAAGLRTYTLVGLASALIMLVSKYGFADILVAQTVVLDPSRIAAQIVSGIGFIGGGVIFVRKDLVRGLTTAATVWLTAAVGMACGAGLPLLAVATTAGHFIVVAVFPLVERRLPRSRATPMRVDLAYREGDGVLGRVLAACTAQGLALSGLEVAAAPGDDGRGAPAAPAESGVRGPVTVALDLAGSCAPSAVVARLAEIDGVVSVRVGDGTPDGSRR